MTLANHKGQGQYSEPLTTRSKYMYSAAHSARSAGKRLRASHDWFWFYLCLGDKVARVA